MRVNPEMEKRWSERKQLSVGVDIYQQGRLLDSCYSRDIGIGGAFLGIESALPMQQDTDVELVFHLNAAGESKSHRINARVTRISSEGVGFKFRDFDTGVFRSLQEIMAFNPPAASTH